MTEEELKAIEVRCRTRTEFVEAFTKIINQIDPIANSKITDDNVQIKIICDWCRQACIQFSRVDSPALIKAIRDRDKEIANIDDLYCPGCKCKCYEIDDHGFCKKCNHKTVPMWSEERRKNCRLREEVAELERTIDHLEDVVKGYIERR